MTAKRKPALPPELDARLRDEPDADELGRMWDLLGDAGPPATPIDTDVAWRRLQAHMLDAPGERPGRASDRPARRHRHSRARWLVSALAASLTVIGLLYLATPVTVTAPAGSFVSVTLPDGSTAELNSGSDLRYDRGFWRLPFVDAPLRAVRLDGEAYFEVERSERPFVVETEDARVRVLGTAFNVRTRDADGTVVTVAEGRVQVVGRAEKARIVLGAGERARVLDGVPQPESASVGQTLVWRSRGFAAQEQPLAAVLTEIERRFALDIALTAADAADDTLTLYFPQPTDAESILRDICTARALNYRRTSRGFEVY